MLKTLPPRHQAFVDHLIPVMAQDARFEVLLGAGSLIHGEVDVHSDLDFVMVVAPEAYDRVMNEREAFAESLGGLMTCFTGEHVGEPRLLICLYGPELLHVDFKFVRATDLTEMVEHPVILWARHPAEMAVTLEAAEVSWPNRSPDWFEARAWVWLHYGATKLQRGELFEAISMLGFFRDQVLGPMLLRRHGRDQRGVRRIEQLGPEVVAALGATHPVYEAGAVKKALSASMTLYLDLRADPEPPAGVAHMPEALIRFLEVSYS